MTYKLLTNVKGYQARLKKLLWLEKKAGAKVVSIDENDKLAVITVANKEEHTNADYEVQKVRVRMGTQDRQPEIMPEVQTIPERSAAEKNKEGQIKPVDTASRFFTCAITGDRGYRRFKYRLIQSA